MQSDSSFAASVVVITLFVAFVVCVVAEYALENEFSSYSFLLTGAFCLLSLLSILIGHYYGITLMETLFPGRRLLKSISYATLFLIISLIISFATVVLHLFNDSLAISGVTTVAFSGAALALTFFAYVSEADRAFIKVGKEKVKLNKRNSIRDSRRAPQDNASELVRLSLRNPFGDLSFEQTKVNSNTRQSIIKPKTNVEDATPDLVFRDIVEVGDTGQNEQPNDEIEERGSFRGTILKKLFRRSTKKAVPVNNVEDFDPEDEENISRFVSHYTTLDRGGRNNQQQQEHISICSTGCLNFARDESFSKYSFSFFLLSASIFILLLVAANLFTEEVDDEDDFRLPLNILVSVLAFSIFGGVIGINNASYFVGGTLEDDDLLLSMITFANDSKNLQQSENDEISKGALKQIRTVWAEIVMFSFICASLFLLGPIYMILEENDDDKWRPEAVIASGVLLALSLVFEVRAALAYWRLRLSDTLNKTLSLKKRIKQKAIDTTSEHFASEQAAFLLTLVGALLFPIALLVLYFTFGNTNVNNTIRVVAFAAAFIGFELFWTFLDCICCYDPSLIVNSTTRKLLPLWLAAVASFFIAGDRKFFETESAQVQMSLMIITLFIAIPLLFRVFLNSSLLERAFMVGKKRSREDIRSILTKHETVEAPALNIAGMDYDGVVDMFNVAKLETESRRKTCRLFRTPVEDIYISTIGFLAETENDGNRLVGVRDMLSEDDDERFVLSLFNLAKVFKEELNELAAECIYEEINLNRYIYLRSTLNKFLFVTMYAIHKEGEREYEEAVKLFGESVEMSEEVVGASLLVVPLLEVRYGLSYLKCGELDEALKLCQSSIKFKEKHCPPDVITLSESSIFLAHCFCLGAEIEESYKHVRAHQRAKFDAINDKFILSQEDIEAQQGLCYQMFELMQQVSTKDIMVALPIYNVALLLLCQNEHRKATPLLQVAVDVAINSVGYFHFLVADMLDTIAELHTFQEDYEEALVFQKEALRIVQKIYGTNNLMVAIYLHKTGERLEKTQNLERALQCYETTLAMKKQLFGHRHDSILLSLQRKGAVLAKLGKEDQSSKVYREVIKLQKAMFGRSSQVLSNSLKTIAAVYRSMGNYMASIDALIDSLHIEEKLHGNKSLQASEVYYELGCAFADQGDLDSSALYLRMANEIQEVKLSLHSEQLADTRHMLLQTQARRERESKQEEEVDSEDESDFEDFESMNPIGTSAEDSELEVIEALDNLGLFQIQRKQYQEALKTFGEALRLLTEQQNRSKITLRVTKHLAKVFLILEEKENALALLQDCVTLERKLYGNNSKESKETSKKIEQILVGKAGHADTLMERLQKYKTRRKSGIKSSKVKTQDTASD